MKIKIREDSFADYFFTALTALLIVISDCALWVALRLAMIPVKNTDNKRK